MSEHRNVASRNEPGDRAPGEGSAETSRGVRGYLLGFVLAATLTAISFWVASTDLFWPPGVAIGLCVLAVAQMGIHLVFFLHLTTGADNSNNALAVAFGALVIVLVGGGSLWIMANLDANMIPISSIEMMPVRH